MNEFLRRLDTPAIRAHVRPTSTSAGTAGRQALNAALAAAGLPVRVANLVSVWTMLYTRPSRYNWMFQYYLRAEGLALSWVGTGRLIFSHNFSDDDFAAVVERFVRAARDDARGRLVVERRRALTNRAIRRAILRELLRRALRAPRGGRRRRPRPSTRGPELAVRPRRASIDARTSRGRRRARAASDR